MTDQDPVTGKFVKGNKANPGGRPKGDFSITSLIDDAVTADDWKFIFQLLLKMARRGNLKAIEILMDRRFGKPPQENRHTGADGGAIQQEVKITDDSIIRKLLPELASSDATDTPKPAE